MWYLYIAECRDGTFYTGITTSVEHRIKAHNAGKGAKYTRARLPIKLLCSYPVGSRAKASALELEIKKLDHEGKARWRDEQRWRDQWAAWGGAAHTAYSQREAHAKNHNTRRA